MQRTFRILHWSQVLQAMFFEGLVSFSLMIIVKSGVAWEVVVGAFRCWDMGKGKVAMG